MDFHTERGSKNVDSSLWPHNSKSLADILTEINQNVQSMLRLVEDSEPVSTETFLCLYQSLGETYNDLNQELLNGLLKFDFKLPCSDHNSASSSLVTSTAHLSSFRPDVSPSLELDLESGTSYSSLKHQLVSPGRTTSSEMLQSDVEKNQSAFLLADMFCAKLETARRELEAKNIDIETEKRHVLDLESKLLDSSYKIENLESELDEIKECLGVSEAEVSKLSEMLKECKSEKAKLQTGNAADLLDSLRAELRSRENQIEQMEEYLNQVCVKETEIMSESGADKNVVEELRARVEVLEKQTGNAADLLDSLRAELRSRENQIEQMEEYLNQVCVKETEIMSESEADKNVVEELRARVEVLEKQVELQRNVISETEEGKREAIRQLCFSLDHYRSRYLEIVRTLSDKKR